MKLTNSRVEQLFSDHPSYFTTWHIGSGRGTKGPLVEFLKLAVDELCTLHGIPSDRAFIAGGFCRDLFCKREFKDVDVFITGGAEFINPLYEEFDSDDQLALSLPLPEELRGNLHEDDSISAYTQPKVKNSNVLGVRKFVVNGVSFDFVFRVEETIEEIVNAFDYDGVKGWVKLPEEGGKEGTLILTPEMVEFFEKKDLDSIPDRATYFKAYAGEQLAFIGNLNYLPIIDEYRVLSN